MRVALGVLLVVCTLVLGVTNPNVTVAKSNANSASPGLSPQSTHLTPIGQHTMAALSGVDWAVGAYTNSTGNSIESTTWTNQPALLNNTCTSCRTRDVQFMVNVPLAASGNVTYAGTKYPVQGIIFQGVGYQYSDVSSFPDVNVIFITLYGGVYTDFYYLPAWDWSNTTVNAGSTTAQSVSYTTQSSVTGWWFIMNGLYLGALTPTGFQPGTGHHTSSITYHKDLSHIQSFTWSLNSMSTTSSALHVSSSYYHPSIALEVNESSSGNLYTDVPKFDAEASVGSSSIFYYAFSTTQFFGIGYNSPPATSYGSGVTFTPGVGSVQYYDEFGPSGGINYWMSHTWYITNPCPSASSCTQTFKTNLPSLNSEGQYYLTMSAGSGGYVSPSSGYYYANQQVQITAYAYTHYAFSYWSCSGTGAYCGSASSYTITMVGAISETANFVVSQYYLTMTAGTGGSVSPSSGYYNVNQQVGITATANSGDHFVSWSGSGSGSYSGSSSSATVTMYGNVQETANFAPNQYYLTMQIGGGGSGSVSPSSGYHNAGSQVNIQAYTNVGYKFCGWTGSGSGSYTGSSNPSYVTMNGPITETATIKLVCLNGPVRPQSGSMEIPLLSIIGLVCLLPIERRKERLNRFFPKWLDHM